MLENILMTFFLIKYSQTIQKKFLATNFKVNNLFPQVLAQLPTSNSSLNLYHNPMGAISDLEVQLMCTGMEENDSRKQPEVVKFSLQCNQTTAQGNKFAFGCNYRSLNSTTHAWDVMSKRYKTNFWGLLVGNAGNAVVPVIHGGIAITDEHAPVYVQRIPCNDPF